MALVKKSFSLFAFFVFFPIIAHSGEESRVHQLKETIKTMDLKSYKKNPTFDQLRELSILLKEFQELNKQGVINAKDLQMICSFFEQDDVKKSLRWRDKMPRERLYLLSCADKLDRKFVDVNGNRKDTCHKLESNKNADQPQTRVFGIGYKFQLGPSKNSAVALRMPYRIDFAPQVGTEEQKDFQVKWSKALQCVESFWRRYYVEIQFILDPKAYAHFTVHPGELRGDRENFYLKSYNAQYFCSWVLHEFGHWMGLPDEYKEPGYDCPQRNTTRKDSMMNEDAINDPRGLKFYPDQLEMIFGPYCGPYTDKI